jgi:cob(I)alamin adenosyltransferase
MKIYTRTGDEGMTGLFGGGRVSKAHQRITAYGTVDETNSVIGLARTHLGGQPGADVLDAVLARIQSELFVAGADLATPSGAKAVVPRVSQDMIDLLERDIDRLEADLAPLENFILPGGTLAASAIHIARTVCRRAERWTVETAASDEVNRLVVIYLNRLSDFLFVAARWINHRAGVADEAWVPAK